MNSIVKIPAVRGAGIFVGSDIILTAAHCLPLDIIQCGGPVVVKVTTWMGDILASPLFADSYSDIAVLTAPDPQACETEPFERFCEATTPSRLAQCLPRSGGYTWARFSVKVRGSDGNYISGEATLWDQWDARIEVTTEKPLGGGSSGGPVLDLQGGLVGIVSNSTLGTAGSPRSIGSHGYLLNSLPERILRLLKEQPPG